LKHKITLFFFLFVLFFEMDKLMKPVLHLKNLNTYMSSKLRQMQNAIRAATIILIALALGASGIAANNGSLLLIEANASSSSSSSKRVVVNHEEQGAPQIITDDYMYIVWTTNKTGNHEVMFRASNDNGATFGDKINLSNSSNAESIDVMMDANGPTVMVSWWERNETSDEPVMRISTDAGETFGPLIMLGANGTISAAGAEEEAAATDGE
jgi:hypothetical protein